MLPKYTWFEDRQSISQYFMMLFKLRKVSLNGMLDPEPPPLYATDLFYSCPHRCMMHGSEGFFPPSSDLNQMTWKSALPRIGCFFWCSKLLRNEEELILEYWVYQSDQCTVKNISNLDLKGHIVHLIACSLWCPL